MKVEIASQSTKCKGQIFAVLFFYYSSFFFSSFEGDPFSAELKTPGEENKTESFGSEPHQQAGPMGPVSFVNAGPSLSA